MQNLSIRERLDAHFDSLTRAEKQLANLLVENYPASGLGSITELAAKAGVSTPTVARLVQKLGYRGFSSFQHELREEVAARIANPIQRQEGWAQNAPDEHVLNRFSDAVSHNVRQTFSRISPEQFDEVCDLLADTKRSIRIVGGRISRSLADYFFTHMQVIRPDVTSMTSNSNAWPHYVLDMKKDDILVMFDMRRYENDLRRLAKMSEERGAKVILFTDQWGSPVSAMAHHKFNAHNEVPSAWDSSLVTMLLLEAIIAQVQQINWDQTKDRMKTLETLFDRTGMFRKFT